MNQVGPVGEGAHEADGEPVAFRLADAALLFDIVRHVRERIALRDAALIADVLVAAREADRLEAEEADLLRVVEGELNDAADLFVINTIDDGGNRDNLHAGFVQIVDGLQLYVEEVAHLAMRVGCVADAVKLKINVAQSGFGSGAAELFALGEFDAIGCGLHRVIPNLAAVSDGVKEVRRERGLAAGELHAHLPAGLEGDGVVQHGLDFVPGKFVDKADLIGIHEAGIAHHVAAVGEVDGEH